jgi:glutamine synthetase adenylyltransferase
MPPTRISCLCLNIPASVSHAEAYAVTAKMCEEFLQLCRLVRAQDVPLEVDARLRPEGRFGAIVRTTDDYRQYYLTRGETWERQALIKARPVAGNPTVGERWRQMVEEEVVYARGSELKRRWRQFATSSAGWKTNASNRSAAGAM